MPARPYTIVSCAVSLDGYLDDTSPDRLILSGPEDLDEVDELRARADAILVGAGTIRADNPRLLIRDQARVAAREAAGRPSHPRRVTVTGTGDLDPAARFFAGPGTPLVYCTAAAAAAAKKNLKDNAVIIDVGAELSLSAVLHDLYSERSVLTLLAEGGSSILRGLLAENLVDELRLAIAPFFVGDEAAPRFALPARYPHGPAAPMTLVDVRRLGDLVVARYRLGAGRLPWAHGRHPVATAPVLHPLPGRARLPVVRSGRAPTTSAPRPTSLARLRRRCSRIRPTRRSSAPPESGRPRTWPTGKSRSTSG